MFERKYSPLEEFLNAFTHVVGAMLSIYAIVYLAIASKTPLEAASTAIFGATMFILFQASALYHAMVNKSAKKVFQKIDHSAIYLLIAGTYTPLLLITVPFPHSIAIMSMIWYLAILGIVFSCITLKFKYLSTGLYLLMGWLSIFLIYHIWTISHLVVIYFAIGGLMFTFGCVFYLLKKYPYTHTIWHLFVIGGAVMNFLAIFELIKAC